MCTEMIGVYFIFVFTILFLDANGQDPTTCSMSRGASCPSVIPLVSGPTCPNGFDQVEKYCFKVSEEFIFWNESKHNCEGINAKLAEPKELSTSFTNYLWRHISTHDSSTTHGFYDRTFSLGGQLTDNTWKWLSGGIVKPYAWSGECLTISITDRGVIGISLPSWDELRHIDFLLLGISCNSSVLSKQALQREYVPGVHKYICQAASENNSYRSCEENGKEYPSGQLVSMNEQQCQQHWCQDGDIQQYTCGNITTGCCEYKGQLYGDGHSIGPEVPTKDCSGCQQLVCQAGIIQWQDCINCSIKCCFFNGASYQPGSHIQGTCTQLVCDGATGQFIRMGIDYNCPKCMIYLDPHIVTYDHERSYSYQGCGNYSLSQNGSTYQPTLAIYGTFIPCGGWSTITCVDTVTFKNDEHTVITIGFKNHKFKIQVNGENYDVPSSSPSIVQVMGTVYPVLAWTSWMCVSLQGSSGILVQFCGASRSNQVYVWADPNIAGGLKGLCGTANDDVDDDFSTRDGTITSPWQRNPPEDFPLSWLTSVTSNGSCESRNARVKRQLQNDCEADSSVLDKFQRQCKATVMKGFSNVEPEEVETIIDDCVYDLCNVSDPDDWIRAVQETAQVQADIQKQLLNFTTSTTTAINTTFATTTAEPYTTPNTTIDCDCRRRCWVKSGYCTNDPESCDGRVKNRGCIGSGCTCCIPRECRPKRSCSQNGGYCTSSIEICDGVTTTGCWGKDCICCLKAGRCQPKMRCWRKGGFCVTNPSTCKGKIINNGCLSENCYCCVNHPKC